MKTDAKGVVRADGRTEARLVPRPIGQHRPCARGSAVETTLNSTVRAAGERLHASPSRKGARRQSSSTSLMRRREHDQIGRSDRNTGRAVAPGSRGARLSTRSRRVQASWAPRPVDSGSSHGCSSAAKPRRGCHSRRPSSPLGAASARAWRPRSLETDASAAGQRVPWSRSARRRAT